MSESHCQPTEDNVGPIHNLICGVCWKDVSRKEGLQTLRNEQQIGIQIALGILASKSETDRLLEAKSIRFTCKGCSDLLGKIHYISSQIKKLEADLGTASEAFGKRISLSQNKERIQMMKTQFSDSFCREWRKFSFQLFIRYTDRDLEELHKRDGNVEVALEEPNESAGRNVTSHQRSEQRKRRRSESNKSNTLEHIAVSVSSSTKTTKMNGMRKKMNSSKRNTKRPRKARSAHKVHTREGISKGEHLFQCQKCHFSFKYGSGSENLRQARMKVAGHIIAEHDFPESNGLNGSHPLYTLEDGNHFFCCNYKDCGKKVKFGDLEDRNKSKKFKEHFGSHYLTEND